MTVTATVLLMFLAFAAGFFANSCLSLRQGGKRVYTKPRLFKSKKREKNPPGDPILSFDVLRSYGIDDEK